MKQWAKPLQKIRQVGNCTCKVKMEKKMQTNTQIIVHNPYQNTVQSAKVKQTKKCITDFAVAEQKKTVTTQEKNVTSTKYAYKTSLHDRSM